MTAGSRFRAFAASVSLLVALPYPALETPAPAPVVAMELPAAVEDVWDALFLDVEPLRPTPGAAASTHFANPLSLEPPASEPVPEEFPGAVAVPVPRLAANARWRRIIDEPALRPEPCPAVHTQEQCAGSLLSRWDDLVRTISALQGEERLQAVNEGVNALLAYASDQEIYGIADHWATLRESLERGRGDCEDIAIAKMWLLHAAGVKLSSMRLVVLKDTLRNLDHAVLSVFENGHQYVLDNTAWKVGRADWMRGYHPIYALSSEQSWIYGRGSQHVPPLQVARSATPDAQQ